MSWQKFFFQTVRVVLIRMIDRLLFMPFLFVVYIIKYTKINIHTILVGH